MMSFLLLLILNCVVFAVAFRELSRRSCVPVSVRVALGILITAAMLAITLWFNCSVAAPLIVGVGIAVGCVRLAGEGLQSLGDALGQWRFWIYLLSVLTSALLVHVFVPIATFLTSPGEIGLHLHYLIQVSARDAMVAVYLAALMYALAFSSRMRTALALFAVGGLIVTLVYTYVLPFGYPRMTGLTFEQLEVPTMTRALRVVTDVIVIVVAGLLVRAALLRFGGKPFLVGIVLVQVSLGTVAAVTVTRDRADSAEDTGGNATQRSQPLKLSKDHPNALVLMLDRFMGSYIELILRTDPAIAQRLSGFVWHPRTVSAGENSIAGLHPIYGGYDYTPTEMNERGRPLKDISLEAFSILPYNFTRKGWTVNMVDPSGLGFTMEGDCSLLVMEGLNCVHIPPSVVTQKAQQMGFPLTSLSKSSYAELLVLLASMRTAPYAYKQIIEARGPWRQFLDHSAGTTFKVWAELKSLPKLTDVESSQSNLNTLQNILPHEPYFLGEDCLPSKDVFRVSEDEAKRRGHASLFALQHANAARCTLLIVADYLDFLKANGVYDNTKIVIVSDHGIVGPVEDYSTRAVAGKTQSNAFVRTRSLMLTKDLGATGELQISEQFLPNAEVPRILCLEIGGCVNPFLDNRRIEAFGRDDPFYISLVPWQFSLQKRDAFVVTTKLSLKGKDPYDVEGWSQIK